MKQLFTKAAFSAHIRTALFAACDAIVYANNYIESKESYIHEISQRHIDAVAERELWKAKAEALERALRARNCHMSCVNSKTEWTCGENRCENMRLKEVSENKWECEHWQFDYEERGL